MMTLMNVDQAAKYLGISKNTLYRWSSDRKLEKIKLGSRLFFSEIFLQKFIEENTVSN